jgi:hypothetical protein
VKINQKAARDIHLYLELFKKTLGFFMIFFDFFAFWDDLLCRSRKIVNYPNYLKKYSNNAKIIRYSNKIIPYPNKHP